MHFYRFIAAAAKSNNKALSQHSPALAVREKENRCPSHGAMECTGENQQLKH